MFVPPPADACKKPCHDCPFRLSTTPYSSGQDIINNVHWYVFAGQPHYAMCHQEGQQGPNWKQHRTKVPKKVCAGWLTMMASEQPDHPVLEALNFDPNHGIPCMGGIVQYVLEAVCPDNSCEGRCQAWFASQPAHKQLRYYLAFPALYGPVFVGMHHKSYLEPYPADLGTICDAKANPGPTAPDPVVLT